MAAIDVMGCRGSGKTTLLNALFGQPLFPYFAGAPQTVLPSVTISGAPMRVVPTPSTPARPVTIQRCDIDGAPRDVTSLTRGSVALELEAAAAHESVAKIDVVLQSAASGDAQPCTAVRATEVQCDSATALSAAQSSNAVRIVVLRWDYLERDCEASYSRLASQRGATLYVVNCTHDSATGGLSLEEIRALASTRLGLESRSLFALNARLALAATLLGSAAPPITVPHVGALDMLSLRLTALQQSSAAGAPRSRAGDATASSASAPAPSGFADRYIPAVMASKSQVLAEVVVSPPPRRPARSESDPSGTVDGDAMSDRYELASHRESRNVIDAFVEQHGSYVPASVRR